MRLIEIDVKSISATSGGQRATGARAHRIISAYAVYATRQIIII